MEDTGSRLSKIHLEGVIIAVTSLCMEDRTGPLADIKNYLALTCFGMAKDMLSARKLSDAANTNKINTEKYEIVEKGN